MRWLVPLAVIVLGGCTKDTVAIAGLEDGRLAFGLPRTVGCLDQVTVTDAQRRIVWSLGDPGDGARACGRLARHRLVFGDSLPGVPTLRPATTLVRGANYLLLGSPGVVVAVFRYNGPTAPPTNFRPGSKAWCAVRYPASKPGWFGQCRIT